MDYPTSMAATTRDGQPALSVPRPLDENIFRTTRSVSPYIAGLSVLLLSRLLPLPVDGTIAHIPSLCIFHNLTGYPCPACGFTRSFVCFAHGHVHEAFRYHPLGPALFVVLAAWSIIGIGRFAQSVTNPQHTVVPADSARLSRWKPGLQRGALIVATGLLMTVWMLRLSGVLPSPP